MDIIKSKPIGEGLNVFRDLYDATLTDIPELSDAVGHMHIGDEGEIHRLDAKYFLMYIDLKNLVLDLILAVQSLPAARLLHSPNSRDTLRTHLLRFTPLVDSGDFDVRLAIPLLNKILNKAPDADIWGAVYSLVTESMPPPRPLLFCNQTTISFNTGSLANTSEYRKHFDGALKDELDSSLRIDIPDFFDILFSELINLESVAGDVFKKCQENENLLYKEGEGGGWRGWPEDTHKEKVLKWFKERIDMFLEFAKECGSTQSAPIRL